MYQPKNDGVDHINIYSKGQTGLGKFLSHFTRSPFPMEGEIWQSVEAYYYFSLAKRCAVLTPQQKFAIRQQLRGLWGFRAKQEGQALIEELKKSGWIDLPTPKWRDFTRSIRNANLAKLYCSSFREEFIASTLPFAHYYFYGDVDNPKVQETKSASWLVSDFEMMRRQLRDEQNIAI